MKSLTVSALVCATVALATAVGNNALVNKALNCDLGWHPFSGHFFRYVPTLLTWAQAENHCQTLGGNLASIHSFTEFRQVQRLIMTITKLRNWEVWVGGSDAQEEKRWLWSDGTPFDHLNWCRYPDLEPNNALGNQHCLRIIGEGPCFDDHFCDRKKPSVCALRV